MKLSGHLGVKYPGCEADVNSDCSCPLCLLARVVMYGNRITVKEKDDEVLRR
jgi:hypothetical protein